MAGSKSGVSHPLLGPPTSDVGRKDPGERSVCPQVLVQDSPSNLRRSSVVHTDLVECACMDGGPAGDPGSVKTQRKGKDPRKHHYVPVFYQRNFANSKGLLWVYDRQSRTCKELHPSVICFEKDLYTVKHEKGPRDAQVESKVLWAVDALGAR